MLTTETTTRGTSTSVPFHQKRLWSNERATRNNDRDNNPAWDDVTPIACGTGGYDSLT